MKAVTVTYGKTYVLTLNDGIVISAKYIGDGCFQDSDGHKYHMYEIEDINE
jgi:hypothetical protein